MSAADTFAQPVKVLTVEALLRAIQERRYVEAMPAFIKAELAYAQLSDQDKAITPAPSAVTEDDLISWPYDIQPFPQDGEVTSLGIQKTLIVLNSARFYENTFYNALRYDPSVGKIIPQLAETSSYTITGNSLPPVPPFTEENWRRNLKLLASNIDQYRAVSDWAHVKKMISFDSTWFNQHTDSQGETTRCALSEGQILSPAEMGTGAGTSYSFLRKEDVHFGSCDALSFGVWSGALNRDYHGNTGTFGVLHLGWESCAAVKSKDHPDAIPDIPHIPDIGGTIIPFKTFDFRTLREMLKAPGGNEMEASQRAKLPFDCWAKIPVASTPTGPFSIGDFGEINLVDQAARTSSLTEFAKYKAMFDLPDFETSGAWTSEGYASLQATLKEQSAEVSNVEGYELQQFKNNRAIDSYGSGDTGFFKFQSCYLSSSFQLAFLPNYTEFLPDGAKNSGVKEVRISEVETRPSDHPVRIHVGRGKSDQNQTGWIGSRWDGLGSVIFTGSSKEFELLHETDHASYQDEPLSPPNTPRGSFDYKEADEFTQSQKENSGLSSRSEYLALWHVPRLRQILGGDVLVDIQYLTAYRKEIKFYWAQDAGSKDSGFYAPTGVPFKTIVLCNPTAPVDMPGLPEEANRLEIIENGTVFTELKVSYETALDEQTGRSYASHVTYTTKQGDSAASPRSVHTVDMPLSASMLAGEAYTPIHWKLAATVDGQTMHVDLLCPEGFSPSDTDEPVIKVATFTPESGPPRTMTWTYWEQAEEGSWPGDWHRESLTLSGPSGWNLNNAQFTFDKEGFLESEATLLDGKPHVTTHEWDAAGLTRTTTSKLDGQIYRTETTAYSTDLTQVARTVDGRTTTYTYDGPGGASPWALKKIVQPGNIVTTISTVPSVDSITSEIRSGWSAQQSSGTHVTTTVNRFGGLVMQDATTTEGAPLSSDTGSDFTKWGLPKTVSHLAGTEHFSFNGDAGHPAAGNNYGTLKSHADPWANVSTVTSYDWLRRMTKLESPTGDLTPDYSDPLQVRVQCSAGYGLIEQFTDFGELASARKTSTSPAQGSSMALDLTPNAGSFSFGDRKVGLDVTATREVLGAQSGMGGRGAKSEISCVDGKICVTTTQRKQNNGTDYEVKTYYDASGRVVKVTSPAADGSLLEQRWVYDDNARKVTYTPGPGPVLKPITKTLSADGSTLTVKEGSQDILRYKREVDGDTISVITEKHDDSSGDGFAWTQVSKQSVNPSTGVTTFTPYDLMANTVTQTQGAPGATTTITVSGGASGDTLTMNLANGLPETLTGNAGGVPFALTQIDKSYGRVTGATGTVAGKNAGFSIDGDGRLKTLQGAGFNKTLSYGGAPGYSTTIVDSVQGTSQTYTFSESGDFTGASGSGIQSVSQSTVDQGSAQYQSTLNGSLTVTTGAGGEIFDKTYAGGLSESTTYNADGTVKNFAVGQVYGSISYDAYSQSTTYTGTGTVAEEFYVAGPRKQVTGPGDIRTFTWQRDSLATETHLAGPWAGAAVARGQDERGLCDSVGIAGGATGTHAFGYHHEAHARPDQVTSSGAQAARYVYDLNDKPGTLSACVRGPLSTGWFYDGIGRVSDVNTTGGFTYHYSHDDRHRRKTRVAGSGASWFDLEYDDADRLLHVQLGDGTVLNYNYDTRGNRLGGGGAVTYTVNSLDQTKGMNATKRGYGVSGTVTPGAKVRVFHPLAPNGEELTVNPSTGQYTGFWPMGAGASTGVTRVEMQVRGTLTGAGSGGKDAVSEKQVWVVVPASHESFDYDGAGRMTGDANWTYTWNGMNHLVGMTRRAGTSADPTVTAETLSFGYDSDGRRTSKTHTVTHTSGSPKVSISKVLWDGWLPVMEQRTVDGVALPQRWFTWGRDVSGSLDGAGGIGGLVCIQEVGGRTLLPVDDGLGNITAVVDAATNRVVAQYDYGPYGEDMGSSGEADACPFRYQSKYLDAETGLAYFGFRYYSPRLGRWLSRDPLGEAGGFNLYAYCGNDPVNKWDYLGMDPNERDYKPDIFTKFFEIFGAISVAPFVKEDDYRDRLLLHSRVHQQMGVPLLKNAPVALASVPSGVLYRGADWIENRSESPWLAVPPIVALRFAGGIVDVPGQVGGFYEWGQAGCPIIEPTWGNMSQGYQQGDYARMFRGIANTTGAMTMVVSPFKGVSNVEVNPARWNYARVNPANYDWSPTMRSLSTRMNAGIPFPELPSYRVRNPVAGDIVNYRPTHAGFENHHGVLDVWASYNVPGYVSRGATTPSMMLTAAQHNATRLVYRAWLKAKTGREVGGIVDWTKVSPLEAQTLSERMFDAAGISRTARENYYRAFNQYIYGE